MNRRRKNGFFTFLCSLVPGAGEMYLGFMKEGISIMGLSFALFAATGFLGMEIFLFLLPLVWFYSFFNVHNKAGLPDEEFYALEDDYLFHLDRLLPEGRLSGRQMTVFAWILILLGISMIWGPAIRSFLSALEFYLPEAFMPAIRNFFYNLPQYVVAFVLILTGVHLIRAKKKELDQEEEKKDGTGGIL